MAVRILPHFWKTTRWKWLKFGSRSLTIRRWYLALRENRRIYSLSRKTVNARENFCNRDQSRLDMKQRAGFFFYKKSSIFPLDLSEKANFWPQTNTSHLIPSVQKPNYRITLKVTANCENLQRYRSASWVKVSQLQKKKRIENHQSQPTSMTFWTARETNTEKHRLWLVHFFLLSDALSSCVWSCLLD